MILILNLNLKFHLDSENDTESVKYRPTSLFRSAHSKRLFIIITLTFLQYTCGTAHLLLYLESIFHINQGQNKNLYNT